jgi:hypothetical protein
MTGTKWFLLSSSREIYFYAKLVDATVTRTLSHTQWRVLGSGPYSTLNAEHREEVINHLCERYFSLKGESDNDKIARYELAAHIKFHNQSLYHDLVVTGLLLDRGGDMTQHDTWLRSNPDYRLCVENDEDENLLLLAHTRAHKKRRSKRDKKRNHLKKCVVKPLWFYHPSQNGKKPRKDTPWVCFSNEIEQRRIEDGFISFLDKSSLILRTQSEQQQNVDYSSSVLEEKKEPISTFTMRAGQTNGSFKQKRCSTGQSSFSSNLSHWYEPNINNDILIEQKRYAISFLPHCPNCKSIHEETDSNPPFVLPTFYSNSSYGSFCQQCFEDISSGNTRQGYLGESSLSFPVSILMRPTLWRFHGQGNDVRRGVWLMDTQRHGLQPYSDESAAVLEDAYLFLKWSKLCEERSTIAEGKGGIDPLTLTVQVMGPDGDEMQLVQFRSLTQITAIPKTFASGFSLFKRRVYRGAHINSEKNDKDDLAEAEEDERSSKDDEHSTKTSQELLAAPSSLHESLTNSSSTYRDDEVIDDAAKHLTLVVHGIGEMLRSTEFFGMSLPPMTSIVDCCSSLRKNHAEVLSAHQSSVPTETSSIGRVEYLPIEWHESFALKSRWASENGDYHNSKQSSSSVTLEDISLSTIPHMREFANETMLDSKFIIIVIIVNVNIIFVVQNLSNDPVALISSVLHVA